MNQQKWKAKQERRRALRVRRGIKAPRNKLPRLTVFRSSRQIYVQIIDDETAKTLVSASSIDKQLRESLPKLPNGKVKGNGIKSAQVVGEAIAKRALEKGIKEVKFDRGPYRYHGRVKAIADAARKAGLKL